MLGDGRAGTLQFYDWQTEPQLRKESRLLKLDRAFHLGAEPAELRFDEVIEDHFSNGGYLVTSCGGANSLKHQRRQPSGVAILPRMGEQDDLFTVSLA